MKERRIERKKERDKKKDKEREREQGRVIKFYNWSFYTQLGWTQYPSVLSSCSTQTHCYYYYIKLSSITILVTSGFLAPWLLPSLITFLQLVLSIEVQVDTLKWGGEKRCSTNKHLNVIWKRKRKKERKKKGKRKIQNKEDSSNSTTARFTPNWAGRNTIRLRWAIQHPVSLLVS